MRRLVALVVMVLVVGAVGSGSVSSEPAVAQATPESGLCESGETVQFGDVQDSDYAAAYILCMRALGLSQGRDGGYGPDRELNRGQMASFLIRLWTDHLGQQCPTGVVVPFTDTAGTTHEANIECLFGLGITQGTSATTYSPQAPLKASQVSRFLYRSYQKAGGDQCAGTDGSELDRAAECLVGLRVAPTTGEATSAAAVTRAQMGVYVIGLWHNLTGKGLPPVPPQLPTTTTQPVTSGAAVLDSCEDGEMLTSGLVGTLGARQNPDPAVVDVLSSYGDEHADTFGGMWIDRDYQALVLAFTDDPEVHRERILALSPAPEGEADADPKTLGEREGVTIDVLQVRYSEAELDAIHWQIRDRISGTDLGRSLGTSGPSIVHNRVELGLFDPAEGALEELAQVVPDPAAVCVWVHYYPPEPPTGPLDVIPDLDIEDPLVTCRGSRPVPYSDWVDPPSIDDVDHPAVDALRAELEAVGVEPMPRGRWVVISIDEDLAMFAILSSDDFAYAEFERIRARDKWLFNSGDSGNSCEFTVVLPDRLNQVEIQLDPDSPPDPASATIHLLATERKCASGREMGDALRGPQVVETDSAVIVAFAAIEANEPGFTCQDNPSTPVAVELSQPLGNRTIHDGLYVPPKALDPVPARE